MDLAAKPADRAPVSRPGEDLHVVVLAGGLAYEREVSLSSGRRVADALHRAGTDALIVDADADLVSRLTTTRPDAVFIALHGSSGEDGALRGVLELLDVPYVGSSAIACRSAWDKPTAKAAAQAVGISTPDWIALPQTTFRELGAGGVLERLVDRFGLPLIVKPAQGGSALGAALVTEVADLPGAMVSCFSYGDTVLVEQYVRGVEVAVTVLDDGAGPRALPAVEIVASAGIFDYTSRYTPGMTTYHTPARLDPKTAGRLAEMAVSTHRALGLRDLCRVDAIVTPAGQIEFLEVNVAPGMTETSLMPMAIAGGGLELGEVCVRLLAAAAARSAARR
ncbi:MAG TPA: D-alanine--D-alanine ligase [Mycobacteriales bacterium]|nr:D-alanine--D-alanine ligase [Mycobacteriales bacterium]